MSDRCPLCGDQLGPGETIFAVELGFGVTVVRHVPASVCETCGESWVEDETAAKLEQIVDRARRGQSQVEVLAYSD
jgi:YgiT-type zinc finger domain-containing protein